MGASRSVCYDEPTAVTSRDVMTLCIPGCKLSSHNISEYVGNLKSMKQS